VRFRNLQSGNWYPEVLENVEADLVWANDSQTFYYVRKHETTLLPYQVWRHTVGSPSSLDELVYEEADDMFYVSLHKTTSLHYVLSTLPVRPPVKFCCLMQNWQMPNRWSF
jgi:oligopeptidase B